MIQRVLPNLIQIENTSTEFLMPRNVGAICTTSRNIKLNNAKIILALSYYLILSRKARLPVYLEKNVCLGLS